MLENRKSITIISGGLDSAVLAYYLKDLKYTQHFLTFNYGQRHSKEILCAAMIASHLESEHTVIDLKDVGKALKGSALTDPAIDVPEGHYTADNMKITVVPNRNAIMLSVAWAVACSERADMVSFAPHAGDHAIYPDCRSNFISALSNALSHGTIGCRTLGLYIAAPFVSKTKAEIVKLGHELNVPFEDTWSCYGGGEIACGRCGTDVERLEAFAANALQDPISYADRDYWIDVTRSKQNTEVESGK